MPASTAASTRAGRATVALTRRYDEPVEVERRDDEPAAFVRRGRRYRIRAVLAHWWETAPWWDGARASDDERELWRVEAVPVYGSSVVVADLCFAWATGTWTVRAVLD